MKKDEEIVLDTYFLISKVFQLLEKQLRRIIDVQKK